MNNVQVNKNFQSRDSRVDYTLQDGELRTLIPSAP
jgi:hypothetical protein